MRRAPALFGIITMFTVGGCTAQLDLPTPPTELRMNVEPGPQLATSGWGFIDLSSVAGATDSKFEFIATSKGRRQLTKGKFRQVRSRNGLVVDIAGIVTCVTVDAGLGRARIGGVITHNRSTDPAFMTDNHEVGDDVWFRVQDGEGHGTVDASTTLGFKPTLVNTSAEYCALPFTGLPWWNPASTFPVRAGSSIEVSP
jgi:hypothetical protein